MRPTTASTGNVGDVNEALTDTIRDAVDAFTGDDDDSKDALTGFFDDAIFGTQATGASDDGNNDAPSNLTHGEMVDGGNEGEERGDPGPIARGEGGTVRARISKVRMTWDVK
jgi:hypothetical protein